jgi:hypothetical protein
MRCGSRLSSTGSPLLLDDPELDPEKDTYCLTLSPLRCLQKDFRTRFQTRDHPVLHTNFLCTYKGLERELVQKSGSNLFRSSDLGGATNEHEPRALPLRHAPCQHNETVISLWISLTVHPLSEKTYFAIEGARLDFRATCTPFKY